MSTLRKFIEKVERAINDFVDSGPESNDPALIRLHQEEEALLEEVKSMNVVRASRSFFTCASVFAVLSLSFVAYLASWPFSLMLLIGITSVIAVMNAHSMFSLNKQLDQLEERHERLLLSMDSRKKKREALSSNDRGEKVIIALDGIDESMPGSSSQDLEARKMVRERIRRLKREKIMPLLNYREKKAKYLLNRDPDGLAKEVQETVERQAEHEAELDVESGMILERSLNAKRETLEKLAQADREFETIELNLESLQSQIEQLESIVAQGASMDLDELEYILDEMDEGLELAPGVAPKELPEARF